MTPIGAAGAKVGRGFTLSHRNPTLEGVLECIFKAFVSSRDGHTSTFN